MQEVVEGDGSGNRAEEEEHDPLRAPLHEHPVGVRGGAGVGDRHVHEHGGDQVGDDGGHEELEEGRELDVPRLPHHQGGDITERTERTAGVGRHHDIDAAEVDELGISVSDLMQRDLVQG